MLFEWQQVAVYEKGVHEGGPVNYTQRCYTAWNDPLSKKINLHALQKKTNKQIISLQLKLHSS